MWKTFEFLCFNRFTLANVVSQKSLHLELHSNNFLLTLAETNKRTFEMTGRNSENVIGDVATRILECLEWLWVREDVPSTLKLMMISDKNENQFFMLLIVIYKLVRFF